MISRLPAGITVLLISCAIACQQQEPETQAQTDVGVEASDSSGFTIVFDSSACDGASGVASRYDPARDCLVSAPYCRVVASALCDGAIVCLVRESDGSLFRFNENCHDIGWRACTAGEQTTIERSHDCP